MDDRLIQLYNNRLKRSHLPVVVDDELVLVKRHLPVADLKEQVMIRNNHDREEARIWHLWVGEEKLSEDRTVEEIDATYREHTGGEMLRLRYGTGGTQLKQKASDKRHVRLTEQRTGQAFAIEKYPAIIGRYDNNDVTVDMNQLKHPERNSISRRHAEISVTDDHFSIRNLSQRNLLMVDDQQLEHHRNTQLLPGSTLRMGKVAFTVDIVERS